MTTLGLQDPAFLGGVGVLDLIAIGRLATASVYQGFSYIRKGLIDSTTINLLTYNGVGSFRGPEANNLPLLIFQSTTNVFLHPGATSRAVGVRWTSTVARTVYVSGTFTKDQVGTSNGVRVAVYRNNTIAVVSPVTINTAPATMSYTRVAVNVAVGDTLDFLVENNGNSNFDNTTCSFLRIDLS